MAWPDEGVQVYTWANKPLASSYIGTVFISDIGGGTYWVSNGVRWKPLNGRCIIHSINTPTTPVTIDGTVRIFANTPLLSAGLFQIGDTLEIECTVVKSNGTAGSMTPAPYFSTTTSVVGTRSNLMYIGPMNGTAVKSFNKFKFRKKSASIIEVMSSAVGGWGATTVAATVDDNITIDTDSAFSIQLASSATVSLTEQLSAASFTVSLFSDIS